MNKKMAVLLLSIVATVGTLAIAGSDPMVGGHEMSPSKNIIQNAVNSDDHTTLVAAVKAAGLVDTLQGPWSLHRICSHQRSLRQTSGRDGRHPVEARKQRHAHQDPDLSRSRGPDERV